MSRSSQSPERGRTRSRGLPSAIAKEADESPRRITPPARSLSPSSRSRSRSRSRLSERSKSRDRTRYDERPKSRKLSRSRSRSRRRSRSRSCSQNRTHLRSRSPSRSRSRSRVSRNYRGINGSPSPDRLPKSSKIIVEKLTRNVQEAHLREIFGSYGDIKDIDLPMNRQFNINKGQAYIIYQTSPAAESAIAHMHEAQLDGAIISVSIVLPRRKFSQSPPPSRNFTSFPRGPPAAAYDRRPLPPAERNDYSRRPRASYSGYAPPPRYGRSGHFRSPPRFVGARSPSRNRRSRYASPPRGMGGYRGRGGGRDRGFDTYRPRSYSRSRSFSPPSRSRSRTRSFTSRSRSRSPPRRYSPNYRRRNSPPPPRYSSPGRGAMRSSDRQNGRRRSPSYSSYSSYSARSRSRSRAYRR